MSVGDVVSGSSLLPAPAGQGLRGPGARPLPARGPGNRHRGRTLPPLRWHTPQWLGTSRRPQHRSSTSRGESCLRAAAPACPQPRLCWGTPPRGVEPAACRAAVPGRKPRFPERAFSGSCETGCKKITAPLSLMAAGPGWRGVSRRGWRGRGRAPHTSHPLTHTHWHRRIPRRMLAPRPPAPFPPASHARPHAHPGPSHARTLSCAATARHGMARLGMAQCTVREQTPVLPPPRLRCR